MNKYLEKIASKKRVGSYAMKKIRTHDLVETALDLKGRIEDIHTVHSRYSQNNKPKKHTKNEILSPNRHRSNRKTS